VERLHGDLTTLRGEVGALVEVLTLDGLLKPHRVAAQAHKRHFREALRRHPCLFDCGFADLLGEGGLAASLRQSAGLSSILALRGCCSSAGRALPLPGLRDACPMQLYVMGGDSNGQYLSSGERLDVGTGTWEALPPMRRGRSWAAAAQLAGCIYVCGGSDGSQVLSAVERFCVADGAWQDLPPMQQRRESASATAVGGSLLVFGGGDGAQILDSVELLDRDGDWGHWHTAAPMLQRRMGGAASVVRGNVYICGGNDGQGPLSTAERRAPVNRWSGGAAGMALPCMLQRRERFAAAAIEGCLYVCGGQDSPQVLASVERFDPSISVWEALPPMPQRRHGVAAAAAAGRLYVCGGSFGRQDLRTVERLDPSTGLWEALRPMLQPRDGAAAAALRG